MLFVRFYMYDLRKVENFTLFYTLSNVHVYDDIFTKGFHEFKFCSKFKFNMNVHSADDHSGRV
jgi:hypothetical protein